MIRKINIFLILCLFLGSAVSLSAQQEAGTSDLLRIEAIVDDYVIRSDAGMEVGSVEDFIIRVDGEVQYMVAALEDELVGYGLANAVYLVPLEAFQVNQLEEAVIMKEADLEKLQSYPALSVGELYDLNYSTWDTPYYNWWITGAGYDIEPYDQRYGDQEIAIEMIGDEIAFLASELADYDVENTAEEWLGEVEAVMVDFSEGQVAYLGIGTGAVLGIGEDVIAIPMERFSLNTEEEALIINLPEEAVETAPEFNEDSPSDPESIRQFWTEWETGE